MLEEYEFEELQEKIIDAFNKSSAVNDTIWFNNWTTLYEQIMMEIAEYSKGV